MAVDIEDHYEDILGKAQRGCGLSDEHIWKKADIPPAQWEAALGGEFSEATARAVAPVLGLDPTALIQAGEKSWRPKAVELNGLRQFNTPFDDMTVNAYLVWDPATREAAIFDSGANATPLIEFIRKNELSVRRIFLTHGHLDHVADLSTLRTTFSGVPILIHPAEAVGGADAVGEGDEFQVGRLTIRACQTPGHSPGGMTYVISGLDRPVAVVGDALFAGSMGGAPNSWKDALKVNRKKILSLPPQTVLCPGHGPLTTVGEELEHNPFYARTGQA